MTPIDQNPDAAERADEEQYTDWQTPSELADTEAFPYEADMGQAEPYWDSDADAYTDTDTYSNAYQDAYQAMLDVDALSTAPTGPDCPFELTNVGYVTADGGGCIYTETLSKEVHDSLTRVVQSIAEGESAGGRILKASADVINSLTTTAYSADNMRELLDAAENLTSMVSSLECVLTKKLCCTLTSLCECAQAPSGPECFVLSTDMENALADIVSSIAGQESAAGELVTAGSNALDFTSEYGSSADVQSVLESLELLVDTSASVEEALDKKLCLSLGAITSCDQELPATVQIALEELIGSIADSETAASRLVTTGAETLSDTAVGGDFDAIREAMRTVQALAGSALRIEEVTMHKLCLALGALCGDDISGQLQCELGDCQNICGVAVSENDISSWVGAQE
ncbi:MAG: hypothetical protein LBK46_08700 [Oscillospiraceae bacterium]|jgi:hypothetical protein|nr:hypothetical protein [Oscillospiraceae bacterium]